MAEILPAARPLVPIRRVETSSPIHPGNCKVTYTATCKVKGCDWTKIFPVRASLEYSVDEHKRRHQRAAEEAGA